MPHTLALRRLRRPMQLAHQVNKTQLPTRIVLEQAAERQPTRREILRGFGAGMLLPLLSPWAQFSGGQRNTPRVVIVGAGFAGLACAYRLKQAGVDSRVLEASDRLGGRVFSNTDIFGTGLEIELGGEFINREHRTIRGFADEFGLQVTNILTDLAEVENDVYYFDGQKQRIDTLVEALRPVMQAARRDLNEVRGDGDVRYDRTLNGEQFDISMSEWFDRHRIDGMIRDLLSVLCLAEYGLDPGDQSAFNLLWILEGSFGAVAEFFEEDESLHIRGGNASIARKLAEPIADQIETGSILEALRPNGSGYRLSVQQNGRAAEIDADLVVLSIPFSTLRHVDLSALEMPRVKRLAIDTLGYASISKLLTRFDRRVWLDTDHNGSVVTDLPFQESWDAVRGQRTDTGIGLFYTSGTAGLAAADIRPEDQAAIFAGQLDAIFPGSARAHSGEALRQHWPSDPFAQGAYACYKPGQITGLRGVEGETVGGVIFCGEHTHLQFQGYMEGALKSGERAAREVLAVI